MMGDCWIKQELDKFIDANVKRSGSVLDYHNRLEWIDHNQLERTVSGEFYKAYWIEEEIEVRLQYINEKNFHEVLIRINDYLKITDKLNIIRLFGFSLNPKTNKYALVTYFENVKFLKQYLMENTLDLDEKLHIINRILIILKTLSENHISLSLNSQNFLIRTNESNDDHVMFSIFTGLERGYGIAYTEILQENKQRNDQSSDVYAILYRIIFEQKPYKNDDIINVFRSKFLQDIQDIQDVQHLLEELIRRYQDANSSVRPTLYRLENILSHDKPEPQNDVTKAKQNEKIKVNTDVEMEISESSNDEINYAKAERKRDDPEVKQKALNERSSGSDGDNNGEADIYNIYKSDTMCIKKAKRKQMESDRENNDITKTEQNKKTKVNTMVTFELTDDKTNYTKSERKRDDSEVKQKALNERSSESAGNNNGEADVCNIDESNIKKAKRKQMESDCENNDITKAEQNKKAKVKTVATSELTNYETNYTRVERKREVKQKLQIKPKPTNKINENTKLPENPASHSHNEIIHNNTITSLARNKNNVNKDYKHVQSAANNIPKAQNDYEKFEKVCEREKENRKVKSKKEKFDDLDSQKRKVVSSRVEPANNDRGNNPKTSKLQVKPKPTNKINENAKLPENPASHSRDEITNDNTVTGIAGCKSNVNKDCKKFEKARELNNVIKPIRRAYFKDMRSNDPAIRQRGTAMYLIGRLVLRVGHERKENEADTVGCCLLRSEHVILESPNIVHLDFPSKGSIRYKRTIKVKDQVYKNLSFFKKSKSEKDRLFDMTNAREVNKFLSLYGKYGKGLTAKDFRTYKATSLFQKLLEKYTQVNGTREQKIAAYRRASRKVAKLLNHRRTVFGNPIKRSRGNITRRLSEITIHLREARQPTTNSKNCEENIMTPASKTSVRSYIDPRITVAWCHKNKMKVEDVFIRSLRVRFKWALTKENELYEF